MRRKRNQPKLIENDHHRQKEGEIEMEPPTASDSDVVLQNTAKASEESSVDVVSSLHSCCHLILPCFLLRVTLQVVT